MGVQGLWKLLECTGRPINPETLEGKILAVDISIWLNQAVKGARDRHGNAIENAHLLTLFHRLCKLLFFRIRPIFVFDGEAPFLKKQTLAKRRHRKDAAVDEAKKTSDKLLRTFLKRQAIKATLAGNKEKSDFLFLHSKEVPSLSQVRKNEEDDLYVLPPLEEKDQNSSEEDEEKEWEERMKHKQILQEEFFENPNSVDIESEDFKCLPPEVKHEILTDMKEFTKRRRTLFETMPEDSNDFSKYQLKGLLKKNDLNKCIQNVQKEMSQQYTGEVQAQIETEGGFLKEVETQRLISEDSSHYILIKGVQSKAKDAKEESAIQVPLAQSDAAPKTYLDLKLASAHKPKNTKEVSKEPAPPSPRTVLAIEEALLDNNSEEEFNDADLESHMSPIQSVSDGGGSVSPRTLQAIQQALDEDRPGKYLKKSGECELTEPTPSTAQPLITITLDTEEHGLVDSDLKRSSESSTSPTLCSQSTPDQQHLPTSKEAKMVSQQSNTNPLFICSSDDEDNLLKRQMGIMLRNIECSPSPTLLLKNTGIAKAIPAPKKIDVDGQLILDPRLQQSAKRNLFVKAGEPIASTSRPPSLFSDVLPSTPTLQSETGNPIINASNLSSSFVTPKKVTKTESPNRPSAEGPEISGAVPESNSSFLQNIRHPSGIIRLPFPVLDNRIELHVANRDQIVEDRSPNNQDDTYLPLTPESIELQEVPDANNEAESDSDASFIEVEDNDSDKIQHKEVKETSDEAGIKPSIPESSPNSSAPSSTILSSDSSLNKGADEQSISPQRDVEDTEASVNEWRDISLDELESLENNLYVEQTSLQAQRQQQERIAATVTGQMCLESQELLRLFGIPFIVAPMEAEAQCAVLDLTDQTSGTITDDSDIWLFGARHVYKNFFTQNKYVEYFQFSDIHNQLGLNRSKLINLAYLMGSDYTEGIPSVGYVSAMEILNEFPGQGLESLIKFKEWWTEAKNNKKMQPNPHDTKVKKKLRNLELYSSFPNKAVADAYLKPVVDESKGAFFWGSPDLELIREFCHGRFGWTQSKTDEVLLPVLKQLNSQKAQLRIDSFFRVEQREAQAIKSQRLRRAVTCMKRKEKEGEADDVEEATALMEKEFEAQDLAEGNTLKAGYSKSKLGKRKMPKEQFTGKTDHTHAEGGFLGSGMKPVSTDKVSGSDTDDLNTSAKIFKESESCGSHSRAAGEHGSSSSSDEEKTVLVTAKPVFQGNQRKSRIQKAKNK